MLIFTWCNKDGVNYCAQSIDQHTHHCWDPDWHRFERSRGSRHRVVFQALTWAWAVFVDCRLRQNTQCNEHHLVLCKSGVLH